MPETLLFSTVAVSLVVIAAANAAGVVLLRRHGAFARFAPIDDAEHFLPAYEPTGIEELTRDYRGSDYR